MSEPAANPFSPRTVLGLVLFGAVAFLAFLWLIGAGLTGGSVNNGGGHGGGTGLNGFAALGQLLERRGHRVVLARSEAALDLPGLVILTPPQDAEAAEIERIVDRRRRVGPTMVILPKWLAAPAPAEQGGKQGWVRLGSAAPPNWPGFHDDINVGIESAPPGRPVRWIASGLEGTLPPSKTVLSGQGPHLTPLVVDGSLRVLAAFVRDDGYYPGLEALAPPGTEVTGNDDGLHPLIFVFEPDLFDNWGMARRENALLADRLVTAALAGEPRSVTFDLTLNGLGRSANLLTLAFTPPYLAATLCLLLAALAAGWRAFRRFGPPRLPERAIAFGKRALLANAAGLIRRTRRLHLVTRPYADRMRERIARALALPREPDPAATEAAIDRALAARAPEAEPFSRLAARLRAAHGQHAILRAAQALHTLERTLTR